METIIIHTDTEKAKALKQFLEAFEVDYQIDDQDKSPYNPEFVNKILSTRNEKSTRINPENVWEDILLT